MAKEKSRTGEIVANKNYQKARKVGDRRPGNHGILSRREPSKTLTTEVGQGE